MCYRLVLFCNLLHSIEAWRTETFRIILNSSIRLVHYSLAFYSSGPSYSQNQQLPVFYPSQTDSQQFSQAFHPLQNNLQQFSAESEPSAESTSKAPAKKNTRDQWAIPENIHTYTTDGFSDFRRGGGVYDYGILRAWGGGYLRLEIRRHGGVPKVGFLEKKVYSEFLENAIIVDF